MDTLFTILIISAFALSDGQYYYQQFRPSPVDHIANSQSLYTGDYYYDQTPIGYNYPSFGMKPPHPEIPVFQKPFFTAAEFPFPAATSGQIDNYNKALKEAQEEDAKAAQEELDGSQLNSLDGLGNSYVDVKLRGHQYRYTL